MGPWAAFKQFIFWFIKELYQFSGDWGIAIIIATVIIRILIFPIANKQFKSSYIMGQLQPQVQEIQKKYAGDQERINQETQRIYAENKYNPLMGCLPMIIQMPIFIALFQVLRSLNDYISAAGLTGKAADFCFLNLVPDLSRTPREVAGDGFMALLPYLILLLVFVCSFFVPMLITSRKPDRTTLMTTGVMSIMMLWISIQSPGGVMLYWDMSSIFGIIQQLIIQKRTKKSMEAAAEERAKEIRATSSVSVVRKEKKKRPTKSR